MSWRVVGWGVAVATAALGAWLYVAAPGVATYWLSFFLMLPLWLGLFGVLGDRLPPAGPMGGGRAAGGGGGGELSGLAQRRLVELRAARHRSARGADHQARNAERMRFRPRWERPEGGG